MKTLSITICTLLVAIFSSAQIPNPSFEDWINDLPVGWNYSASAPGCPTTIQSSDAYSGAHAVRVENSICPPDTFYGLLISIDSTGNSFPVSQLYTSLTGYYKADFVNNDLLDISIFFNDSASNLVALGQSILPGSTTYQQFSVDIQTFMPGTPATATIYCVIRDTLTNASVGGSYFLLDDLSLQLTTNTENIQRPTLKVFPNPAADLLSISNVSGYSNPVISLTSLDGKKVFVQSNELNPGTSAIEISLKNYTSGSYILEVLDEKSANTQRSRIVIQH